MTAHTLDLPANFQFSQSSLQDYADCARRFELRYLQGLRWPSVQAEPVQEHERRMRQGSQFHHMVHQYLLGVPEAALSRQAMDTELAAWWNSFLNSAIRDTLPAQRHPELQISVRLNGHALTAKYDLIAVQPGEKYVIVDWKTSRHKPKRDKLAKRLQTMVYPYVLVEGGGFLNNGKPIPPEQVQMIYWFATDPDSPEIFTYDADTYAQNAAQIAAIIREIEHRTVFELTTNEHQCRFCTYRSLCERGIRAGDIDEVDDFIDADSDHLDFEFSFDQIAEVEF